MKRILSRDTTTRNNVYEFFNQSNLVLVEEMPGDEKSSVNHFARWRSAGTHETVTYIEDRVVVFSYLILSDCMAATLFKGYILPDIFVDKQFALSSLAEASDQPQMLRATMRLGLLAHGDFDPDIFRILSHALSPFQPNDVKREVLTALCYTNWPEFGPVLTEMAAHEGEDPILREEAHRILSGMQQSHWNIGLYRDYSQ